MNSKKETVLTQSTTNYTLVGRLANFCDGEAYRTYENARGRKKIRIDSDHVKYIRGENIHRKIQVRRTNENESRFGDN